MERMAKEMPITITRSDGVKLTLKDINVSTSINCNHNVAIDNIPMEVTYAIRYLLADRDRIMTLLADARAKLDKLS